MPGRTNTDLIRELGINLADLERRADYIEKDLDRLTGNHGKAAETVADLAMRLAVLESKMTDMKAVLDEADRRRWAVWLAAAGSILTMVVNIALLGVRK